MAMLNLPLPGEAPIEMAADNLQPSMLSAYAQELGINDAERLSVSQRQYLEYYMQRKSMSTVTLVDPAAVVRMIRYFGDKAESKRERVYNYWPE
jgi:hypothetical protein